MPAPALQPGDMLLHYRLAARIGSGGMGDVWKAFDTKLQREVALKFIDSEHVADPVSRRRLLQEARLASCLSHPNIVTIYDVHMGEPLDFIAMEYVRGETLFELLHRTKMSVQQALSCAVQVADGLAAAHAAGIVHRDLKPGNIMLGEDGRARVVDFGLARWTEDARESDSAPRTNAGVAMGTFAYMSPEQFRGQEVGSRSDVYSFGLVMADMLPSVPVEMEPVMQTCLERDPARRYPSCTEVAAALRQVSNRISALSGAETVALPVALTRRRRWAPILAVVIALILAAGLWMRFHPRGPRQRGVAVLPFASTGADSRAQAFGMGVVMALANQIAGVEAFRQEFWVVSPADVMQAKVQSARDARQLFGVDLVVSGRVELAGDRVRVTTSLSDARTQRQLRSRQITTAADSWKLEDEIAGVAADLLEVRLPASAANAPLRAAAEPGAEDYYLQGRGYLQSGDQAEAAIAVFQEALRRDPNFARAHAGLAAAWLQKFRATRDPEWIARARASADNAIRLGGRTPESLTSLALIAREEGRYAESAALLQEVLRADPRNMEAWTALARAEDALKRAPEAEAAYRRVVALYPGNPSGHEMLGVYFYNHGRYAEAESSFVRARNLAPDSYRAWYRLGALYLQTGRLQEAEAAWMRSLALRPNGVAYNNLAALYFDQERYAEAARMMEKSVEIGPVSVVMLASLARAYRHVPALAGKVPDAVERARALAAKVLAVNPRDADTHADLGLLLAEEDERQAAGKEIETALTLAPASGAVLFRAVMAYEAIGRRDDALQAWHKLAKSGGFAQEIQHRPELKALRADPRFNKGEK